MNEEVTNRDPWVLACMSDPLYDEVIVTANLVPLFAVESGSRAWGFDSPDSDYDVRFIYRRPREWYLGLDPTKDARADTVNISVEGKDGMLVDAVGWDVRKFLQLARGGNANPYEWFFSCPTYYVNHTWADDAGEILRDYLNPVMLARHHRGLAYSQWYKYVKDKDEIIHKKYLYVLRSLWSMEWYMNFGAPGHTPPIRMLDLMDVVYIPDDIEEIAREMVSIKRDGYESGTGPANISLGAYIEQMLNHWSEHVAVLPDDEKYLPWPRLNELFMRTLDIEASANRDSIRRKP